MEDLEGWRVGSGGAHQATWEVAEKEWEGEKIPVGSLTYEFMQRGSGWIGLRSPFEITGDVVHVQKPLPVTVQ